MIEIHRFYTVKSNLELIHNSANDTDEQWIQQWVCVHTQAYGNNHQISIKAQFYFSRENCLENLNFFFSDWKSMFYTEISNSGTDQNRVSWWKIVFSTKYSDDSTKWKFYLQNSQSPTFFLIIIENTNSEEILIAIDSIMPSDSFW